MRTFIYLCIILLETLFISAGGPNPNYNIFLGRSSPNDFPYDGTSYFGGLDAFSFNTFPSPDITSGNNFLFPSNNQRPSVGQLPQLPVPPPAQDPSTLGCGQAPASCPTTRYRSYDGTCNNLRNPVLGSPQTPYTRLLPPNYGDGIMTPTVARSGRNLPLARMVSLVIYPDVQQEDPIFTLNAMQYGQIITHDMSMIAGSTQAQPHATKCCTSNGQLLEFSNIPEHCFPVRIPDNDPAHGVQNVKCMNFVRTLTDRDRNCVGGNQPAEQLTAVNHFLDLSIVYGNTDQVNQQVRQFQGGRLRVDIRGGRQWLPRNTNASGICTIQNPQEACYMAGDTRVNQNPQLTLLQTILLREHNRVAGVLAKLNPQWNDETIFQEARKITIAEHQHISYYEWLPIFIGIENSLHNKIIYKTRDFVNDYSETVNPTILNEHATAAFRFFHSLIAGRLDLVNEQRSSFGSLRLSDWLNRPAILEEGDNFDELTRGLATQPQLASDKFHDSEITQFMFRAGQQFGQDLKAIDIQRNRDHGLASYNDYRAFCGLKNAHSFNEFLDVMTKESVQQLASLYEDPNDVELTVGGSLEILVPGTLSGPTFLCILTEQFYRSRRGDRFWFENSGETGFTLGQLNELRKSSISRLLCDNGDNVRAMQPRGFERISSLNNVVPCESLPAADLSLWKDVNRAGGAGREFLPQDSLYKK